MPWSTRDVWLGVIAAAVLARGRIRPSSTRLGTLSLRLGVDLWVALIPTLFELLFLIPVWWFAVRKYHASLKTLGFVNFKFSVLAVGLGLLVGLLHLQRLLCLSASWSRSAGADRPDTRLAPAFDSLAVVRHDRGRRSVGGRDVLPRLCLCRSALALRLAVGGSHKCRAVRGRAPVDHVLHPRVHAGLRCSRISIRGRTRSGRESSSTPLSMRLP